MSGFELDAFLIEISPDAPCGEDISDDITFMELQRLIQGKAQTPLEKRDDESEEPDWEKVYQHSLNLLQRSRDLRLIIYLTVSKLCQEGLSGFYEGLSLLCAVLERYWNHLFPQLDPDDDNDPMERLNILGSLSPVQSVMSDQDAIKFIPRLMNLPLCRPNDARLPHPSLKQIFLASGEISVPKTEGSEFPNMQLVDAAFDQTDIQDLQATNQLLNGCIGYLHVLDQLLTDYVGATMAPSFKRLEQVLMQMQKKTGMYLERRGYGQKTPSIVQAQKKNKMDFSGNSTQTDESQMDKKPMELVTNKSLCNELSGQISSNQDVHKALDMIIFYYEQNEPSSPVPLLLKRAKRLVGRSFVDIIRNLSPDAMTQVQMLSGEEDSPDK